MNGPDLPEAFRIEAAEIQGSLDRLTTALVAGQVVDMDGLEQKIARLCRRMTEASAALRPSCLLLAEDILRRLDGLQRELTELANGGTDGVA